MLRHVAVFRWLDGTSPAEVEAFSEALSRLPGVIPEIRSYRFGPDAELGMSANGHFAVVADFDDSDAYRAYAEHPAHRDVIVRLLRPILAERMSVQHQIEPDPPRAGPAAGGG